MKRRVGDLAYELKLPDGWKIYLVISVEYLSLAPMDADDFGRVTLPPGPVARESDDEHEEPSFEIEAIRDAKVDGRGCGGPRIKYLILWKGYGRHEDKWRSEEDLASAPDTLKEFQATERFKEVRKELQERKKKR